MALAALVQGAESRMMTIACFALAVTRFGHSFSGRSLFDQNGTHDRQLAGKGIKARLAFQVVHFQLQLLQKGTQVFTGIQNPDGSLPTRFPRPWSKSSG